MYWVQISQEIDDLLIQFYAHPNKKCWEFQIDEAVQAIEEAKKRLLFSQLRNFIKKKENS